MRRFNAKLFFCLVFGSALAVALTFLVHWFQTGRIAQALLAQADRAEQQGNTADAVRYLSRYLELEQDDVEARARLGQALADDKAAVNPRARSRALFVLEQVLAKLPERRDLRLRLVRIAIDLDRRDVARDHLGRLLQERKDDGEAEFLFGQLCEAEQQWERAAVWYRHAVEHTPQQIAAYVRLADVLRRRLKPEQQAEAAKEADQVMQAVVANNKDDYHAHLARWQYLQQHGKLDNDQNLEAAAVNVVQALELAPNDAEVLLAGSDLAQARKEPQKSRDFLRRGRELYPHDVRMVRESAWLELRQKNTDAAVAGLREGIATVKAEDKAELLWMLGNVLIDAKNKDEAAKTIAQLGKTRASRAAVDYLQARLYALDSRWSDAAALLERSRELLATSPEVARQADLLLAHCYHQLNNSESELAAYARLTARDPASLPGLLGKAAAHAALGQLDDALLAYQQASRLSNAPSTVWLDGARLVVLRNIQAAVPDWNQAEDAIKQAVAKNPEALEGSLLQVEMLVAQGRQARSAKQGEAKLQQADELLQKLRSEHPERIEVWSASAALADVRGQRDDAARFLEQAEKTVTDKSKLCSAQIQFWARRGGAEATTALGKLAGAIASLPAEEQARLFADLAQAHYRLGNSAEAEAIWNRLAKRPEGQNDLQVRLFLFEAAVQAGKEAAAQEVVAEMKRIEGDAGIYWRYCRAVTLIRQARKAQNRAGLDEARALLAAVSNRRPAWPPVLIARADIEDLTGNADEAVASYRRAVELGERNPRVVRMLVEQLYKRQRYEEAEQEIRKLQKQAPSADLQRLLVAITLQKQDYTKAANDALEAIPANSTDYRDYLWLGQVFAAGGAAHAEEAEKNLRKAVELGKDKPETWLALVQFLARTKKTQEAETAIQQLAAAPPSAGNFLSRAVCQEALGQFDQAKENYQKALAAGPDDIVMMRAIAGFHLRRGDVTQAEPLLRQIMAGKAKAAAGDQGWARRNLALALAGSDFRRFGEALALVGLKDDGTGKIEETAVPASDDAAEELRTRIRVLSRLPRREARLKAVALLEDLDKRQKLAGDDQFVLAQLYESDGDTGWRKARDLFRQATVQGKNPIQLVYFTQALLRHKETSEAERCINQLAKLEKDRGIAPGSFGSIELRAQVWEAQGQGDRALTSLKEYAERPDADPERRFLVIQSLARQGRFPEALAWCEQARANSSPEKLGALTVALLQGSRAKEEQLAGAADWLKSQIVNRPQSAPMLLQLAALEDLRGRYDQVEQLYRQALKIDERNVVALNNLAWQLAQQKPQQVAEALTLINRAIELAGPQPDLLDTRASVYIAQNKGELAIADLEIANADRPAPTRYFHLAQAHRLTNNKSAAAALLKKATASGLKPELLHPAERVAFIKLLSEMEQR